MSMPSLSRLGACLRPVLAGGLLALCALFLAPVAPARAADDGQTFGDWKVKCETIDAAGGKKQCFLFQEVSLEAGKPMLNASVGYLGKDNKPMIILTVPLGVFIPPGVGIKIDDTEPVTFHMQICAPDGCQAAAVVDDALLDRLRKGTAAKVAFLNAKRKEVVLSLSLKGFTNGLAAVK